MGYDAELAGKTQLPGALLLIVLMPLGGMLVKRIQARWLIGMGIIRNLTEAAHNAKILP
jgi:hypothetical protein